MDDKAAAAYLHLQTHVHKAVIKVLQAYQMAPAPADSDPSAVFLWASVHSNGSAHWAHFHERSGLSGVYYVQLPCGSGSLAFYDPRGSRPPFSRSYEHQPEEGEIVVFPS